MITVRFGKKKVQVPENLNEFSKKQLLSLVECLYFRVFPSYEITRFSLLKILLGQSELFYDFWKKDAGRECMETCVYDCNMICEHHHLFNEEITELLKLTNPFFKKISKPNSSKDFYTLKINLSKQIIPYVRIRGIKWTGPDDAIEDLTFDKWIQADLHYMYYLKTNDENHLDSLIAYLYEPFYMKYIRIVFPKIDNYTFSDNAKHISRLDKAVKFAIFLFYISSRAFLAEHFNHLFKIPEEGDLKETPDDIIRSQWYDTKFNIAENKLFGNFDNVGTTKIASIMKHLQMLIIRQKEEKIRREEAELRNRKQ